MKPVLNNMRSGTADFVPDTATWRTGRNTRAVFDYSVFAALFENDVIRKTGNT